MSAGHAKTPPVDSAASGLGTFERWLSVIPLSDGIGATLLDGQSTARADMTCSVCRLAQK